MLKFSHSGSLGDLIYSLPVIKKAGGGDFRINARAVHKISALFGYDTGIIPEYHKQMLNDDTIDKLRPLLDYQSYIGETSEGEFETDDANIQLDAFRGVLWRIFTGNYVEAYYRTFAQAYTAEDIISPWLTAPTKRVAKYVITRTARYRDETPAGIAHWKNIIETTKNQAVYVGFYDEYQAFCKEFDTDLPYYENGDFLDLAAVINGCDQFIGNQTFAYALAVGLGKPTILETWKRLPLEQNECYFNRLNAQYF